MGKRSPEERYLITDTENIFTSGPYTYSDALKQAKLEADRHDDCIFVAEIVGFVRQSPRKIPEEIDSFKEVWPSAS